MENYKTKDNYTLSICSTEKVLFQMRNCICKIYKNNDNEKSGTGFFCKIPFGPKIINVLITNNHIINEEDIKNDKIIKISLGDKQECKNIKLDSDRTIFTDKNLDITFIEINPEDKIENFLEIDDNINENSNNLNDLYKDKFIYLLHYRQNENIVVSYGSTYNLMGNNIYHYIQTDSGSSGSPILSLSNHKVIGIHKGNSFRPFNLATFIKYPILKFYQKEDELNELTIRYKVNNSLYKIKLFDEYFVNQNKDKCKLLFGEKIKNLTEKINFSLNDLKDSNILEIKLIEIKKITNMCQMFNDCKYLYEIPDFPEWNMKNITDISNLFFNCSSLENLPDISKWNTENITNMGYMFYGCKSLKYIPDISKWNTKKVTDISNLFNGCSSLINLPDISIWFTNNIYDINNIFNGCSSLENLPDISKWNTEKIIDMSHIFYNCSKLTTLPDISKWNISKVTTMSRMFYGCSSLITLPDISILNIINISDINGLFYNCSSLVKLPDISKWDTKNVTDMSEMFSGCKSLICLPDISKWNTNNVTNITNIFYGCKSLSKLPDISKWNTKNFTDMSSIFYGCSSLSSLPNISKWNTDNVFFMSDMFNGCISLTNIPDISNWNINNVNDNKKKKKKLNDCINLLSY